MSEAARRNLAAAELLDASHPRDVAGYLYGIAAECAIKEMIKLKNERPNRGEIWRAHFPKLQVLLRDEFKGRKAPPAWVFIVTTAFMHDWHVTMRYSDANQVPDTWVDDWKIQARKIVGVMGTS